MKKILLSVFLLLLCFLVSCDTVDPLDEIKSYTIYVSPTEEGNLDLHYTIQWQVLDDQREGPLEWVKIGVPNRYIQNLKAYSSEIKKISYYNAGGSFVRLDLDRAYHTSEIVTLDFSFTQTHIYNIKEDTLEYQLIPGWFDEIRVLELEVYWEKRNVTYSNSSTSDENYFIWKDSLDFGESIEVNVCYNKDDFVQISKDNSYKKDEDLGIYVFFIILTIIIITFIIIGIIAYYRNDHYYSYRGFSGQIHHWWRWRYFYHYGVNKKGERISHPTIKNGGSSHHTGGGCACACACACAGGGRAGCSRKDFYDPDSQSSRIIQKLK